MAHAPTDILELRLRSVRRSMAEQSLDALVVTSLPNILYLTNFAGSSAIAVLSGDRVEFITDFRYVAALSEARDSGYACPGLEMVPVDRSYDETLATTLVSAPSGRVGFEAAHLPVSRHSWLLARIGKIEPQRELVPTIGLVERARVRKDSYELQVLREAGDRLSTMAQSLFASIRSGMSERELAMIIDWRIREAGFERPAFETIVASGPQAALPHARPSGRRFSEGDLLVLDFGGVYDSYCVDLTRTVSIGPASERARDVHSAVRAAHREAISSVKPGVSRFDVDATARAALARAGMDKAFGHGTGHGLGIEVHEDPRIVRRRTDAPDARDEALAAAMVFTIEPGAYFPGWGGVRIEDDVVVTQDGVELLTHVTTDLLEL